MWAVPGTISILMIQWSSACSLCLSKSLVKFIWSYQSCNFHLYLLFFITFSKKNFSYNYFTLLSLVKNPLSTIFSSRCSINRCTGEELLQVFFNSIFYLSTAQLFFPSKHLPHWPHNCWILLHSYLDIPRYGFPSISTSSVDILIVCTMDSKV